MLALIPARGGSKGLPGKNIKPLCGRPLITYAIDAAKQAAQIERVVVDTDDEAIAAVARSAGAEVPYCRPAHLASDQAAAIDVYLHAYDRLQCDEAVILLPTAPLRTAEDIDTGIAIFRDQDASSVISVCEAPVPPSWLREIDEQGVLRPRFQDAVNANRQETSLAYVPNGALFILTRNLMVATRSYYDDRTYPYVMPRERSVDIDDAWDFAIAEMALHQQASEGGNGH